MEPSSALLELAGVSLACRDRETLLKTFAARLGPELQARAVLIWLAAKDEDGFSCRARWTEPGERLAPIPENVTEGVLSELSEDGASARRYSAAEIDPGQLVHLEESQRGKVKTALYAVLQGAHGMSGAVEVLNKKSGEFTQQDATFLEEASRLAGQALSNLDAADIERQAQFTALERLTSLYDLGRIFNSTLELHDLLPIIASKVGDMLYAQACNIWLIDTAAGNLQLAHRAGNDPSLEEGARAPMDSGHLGETVQQGSPRLVEDPAGSAANDEFLTCRMEAAQEKSGGSFAFSSIACAPLRKDQEVLGAIELVNKTTGSPFDEDDLFFLDNVSEQAAVALHNAKLLESERKVGILDALLKISQEITSTLDLDHIFTTVVHQAATIVPFDRCVIGFYDRGKFVLGAVSGETEVLKSREMDELSDVLEWAAEQQHPSAANQYQEGWEVVPADGKSLVVTYLEKQGQNGFYALPLHDEQGTLGVFALFSSDADFLSSSQRETLGILASQISVAIRNAQLYQQVPLAGLLNPLAARKKRLLATVPQGERLVWVRRVAVAALVLAIIPWPIRLGTAASVVPAESRTVSAFTGGVVQRVYVHEGDRVSLGQPLAQLDDGDDRVKLASAQTDLSLAARELSDAEYRGDSAAAGQARLHSDFYQTESKLEQQRVAAAQLRAPIAGIVVTPKVEEKTGTALKPGEALCEVVAQDPLAAEMNIAETDLPYVRVGSQVAIKLNSYPTVTFAGAVDRVGGKTVTQENEQFFVVRASFANPQGLARDGMAGRARVRATGGWFDSGWYPVGFVMFRSLARWVWTKAWTWMP
jgi:RND family efflux transporter MFP subunit